MSNKTYFNMQMTETQKDIMDLMIDYTYNGAKVSKASYIWDLIYNHAMQFLCFPEELKLTDDIILQELLEKKQDEQEMIKKMIGEEKYNDLIEKYKKESSKKTIVDL